MIRNGSGDKRLEYKWGLGVIGNGKGGEEESGMEVGKSI